MATLKSTSGMPRFYERIASSYESRIEPLLPYVVIAASLLILWFGFNFKLGPSETPSGPAQVRGPGAFLSRPRGVDALFHIDNVRDGPRILVQQPGPNNRAILDVPPDDILSIQGWAIDDRTKAPPMYVVASMDSSILFASPTEARPDVRTAYKLPAESNVTGFTLSFPLGGISAGVHHMAFSIIDSSGVATYSTDWQLAFRSSSPPEPRVKAPAARHVAESARPTGAQDYFDLIGQTRIADPGEVQHVGTGAWQLTGWATFDSVKGVPFSSLILSIDGRQVARVEKGTARPDVARVLHSPKLTNSGFVANIPAGSLKDGNVHVLTITVISADGHATAASPTLKIQQ